MRTLNIVSLVGADNQYTIVGGRNIGDEYFDAEQLTNFYDMDAMATGSLVHRVSIQFDTYWNHETAVPIYAFEHNTATASDLDDLRNSLTEHQQSHRDSPYADDVRTASIADALRGKKYPAYTGTADVIYDDPAKGLGLPPEEYASMYDLMEPYLQTSNVN